MCRMLAVIGGPELQRKAMRAFHRCGACGQVWPGMPPGHLDGWGIVGYGEHGAAYAARSPGSVEAERKEYLEAVEEVTSWGSPIVIVHLRKASRGDVRVENVHPFVDPPWVFCHNGTIEGLAALGPKPALAGTSDTEEWLCRWRKVSTELQPAQPIVHFIEWIKQVEGAWKFTSLTSLLTNGEELLAHRRYATWPFRPEHDVATYGSYYTLYHWQSGKEHVIASEALQELPGPWRLIENSESVILQVNHT